MSVPTRQERRSEYRLGPGASTLLMIFVSLAMSTISILTLVSAMADTRLTERAQMHIAAYYDAAAQVQRELAIIDGELADLRVFAKDSAQYADEVLAMQNEDIDLIVEEDEEDADSLLMSFAISMYDGHEIFVQLRIPLLQQRPRYYILSHIMRNADVWMPSDDIELFHPEGFGDDFESQDLEDAPDAEEESA